MARKNNKLWQHLKDTNRPKPSDFTSQTAYEVYLHLSDIQRGGSGSPFYKKQETQKRLKDLSLYEKREFIKKHDEMKRKQKTVAVMEDIKRIASQPKYRSNLRSRRIKKYDFLAGNGSKQTLGTGHIIGSVTGGGIPKVDSSHNTEDYKWSNKNALKFSQSLDKMRKYREMFQDDE